MTLLILADDLTGALDTGVQFAGAGISTTVLLDADGSVDTNAVAVAVNLAARHMSPNDAYAAARDALKRFDAPFVYIKTDSALRGNISAIFAAALHERGAPLCFAPAFPQAGRYVRDGIHYIGGVRLEDSVFRDDPMNPMRTSRLTDILSASHNFSVNIVPESEINMISADFDGAFVFDCATLADMCGIADCLQEKKLLGLVAGCAGFATILPEYIALDRDAPEKPVSSGPLLCISGSANEIGLEQIHIAVKDGMQLVFLDPRDTLDADNPEKYVTEILDNLADGKSVIAVTARDASDTALYRETGKAIGITENEMHSRISAYIARLTRLCADKWNSGAFVLIGGDAAHAILTEMDVKSVHAVGEVEAGVAVSTGEYGGLSRIFVTKSGAIGCPNAYGNIQKYFLGV